MAPPCQPVTRVGVLHVLGFPASVPGASLICHKAQMPVTTSVINNTGKEERPLSLRGHMALPPHPPLPESTLPRGPTPSQVWTHFWGGDPGLSSTVCKRQPHSYLTAGVGVGGALNEVSLHPSLPSLIIWKPEKGGERARSQRARIASSCGSRCTHHEVPLQRTDGWTDQEWPFGFAKKTEAPGEERTQLT